MARDPFFQSQADTAREGVVPVRHPFTAFVRSLRPDQWTKNLIVLAGLIFGERLLEPSVFGVALWAFVVFCGLSSAMYLVNDLADREEDQRHPTKSKRPIVAGQVSTKVASVGAAGLVGVSLGAAF